MSTTIQHTGTTPVPSAANRTTVPRIVFPIVELVTGMRPTTVIDAQYETPTIVSVRLEPPAGFAFRAGQHALLGLVTEAGPDLRPLSIASAPRGGVVEFATRIGPSAFKQAFAAFRPGDQVKVSRAMGNWTLDPDHPAVVVAGGIGITPVKSVLLERAPNGHPPVRLLFSNRSADESPFRDELADLQRAGAPLDVAWFLTDSAADTPAGEVHRGRIDRGVLGREADAHPGAIFYVTGPDAMVRSIVEQLAEIGVPKTRVRPLSQGYR